MSIRDHTPGIPARVSSWTMSAALDARRLLAGDERSRKRLTLVACILGSGIALLDGTVVNVALPTIQRALGGGLAAQQWVANGYLLTLGSLILLGGSLGYVSGAGRDCRRARAAGGWRAARARIVALDLPRQPPSGRTVRGAAQARDPAESAAHSRRAPRGRGGRPARRRGSRWTGVRADRATAL